MSRQPGLHGPIEDNIVDWTILRKRILADGRIDEIEARAMLHLHDARNRTDSVTVRTLRTVNAALGGSDGVRSPSFLRLVHSRGEVEPKDAA